VQAINGPLQSRLTTLDLDFSRANRLPDDYDTDLESPWSNLSESSLHTVLLIYNSLVSRTDLFANGEDFSWNTIQTGRNAFYQKQLAQQLTTQTKETTALLTAALKVHLNLDQHLLMNTSAIFVSMETVSINSLTNRTIQPMNNAHIRLPTTMLDPSNNQTISLRVRSSSHQNIPRSLSLRSSPRCNDWHPLTSRRLRRTRIYRHRCPCPSSIRRARRWL
jgi:hypothetical protein